jgi:hypothetical protein
MVNPGCEQHAQSKADRRHRKHKGHLQSTNAKQGFHRFKEHREGIDGTERQLDQGRCNQRAKPHHGSVAGLKRVMGFCDLFPFNLELRPLIRLIGS